MTTNGTIHGQTRKSLASQLDRLDTILDTLEQGLQEAVASAVQEAVGLAVREAIKGLTTEVVTNPVVLKQVRGLIAPVIVPSAPKSAGGGPKLLAAVTERFGHPWCSIKNRVEEAKQACRQVQRRFNLWTGKLLSRLQVLRQFQRPLLLSLAVGLASGVGAYFAGPYVAAAAGWLGGFATTISVQAALAWERLKVAARVES